MGIPVLEVINLRAECSEFSIKKPVSFTLEAGDIAVCSSMELNSGSDFMHLICCGRGRTGGEILVSGKKISSSAGKMNFGFASAAPGFYPEMTVWNYLNFFAELYGIDKHIRPYSVNQALSLCRSEKFGSSVIRSIDEPHILKRINLARALVHSPDFVAAEDLLGLDSYSTIDETISIIEDVRSLGKAILISSESFYRWRSLLNQAFLIGESGILFYGRDVKDCSELDNFHLIQIQTAEDCFNKFAAEISGRTDIFELQKKDDDSCVMRFFYHGLKSSFEAFIQKEMSRGLLLVSCSYQDNFFDH